MTEEGKFWVPPKEVMQIRTRKDGTKYTRTFMRSGHWRRKRHSDSPVERLDLPFPEKLPQMIDHGAPGMITSPSIPAPPSIINHEILFVIKHGPNDRVARVYFNPAHVISVTESTNPDRADVTLVSGEVVEVNETFDLSVKKLFNVDL